MSTASRAVSRTIPPLRQLVQPSQAYRRVLCPVVRGRSLATNSILRQKTQTNTVFNTLSAQQRRAQSSQIQPAPTFYTDENPGRTALYELHLKHGAKMVPFGGYLMPLQYGDLTVGSSHVWTRKKASLFDVGHMVQYEVEGPGAESFLESVTPCGLKELKSGQSSLSALLHPSTGGINDDCIITRLKDGPNHLFFLVCNAGCREKDYKYLSSALEDWNSTDNPAVQLRHLQHDNKPYGLIAIQGPLSVDILSSVLAKSCKVDLQKWYFGESKHITIALASRESLPILASRGGYTGEDGFELSIHPSEVVSVTHRILKIGTSAKIRFAGLAARDSLRLEAGMCLYGHDLNDTTTPIEASLSWIIHKNRRSGERANFPGADIILRQLNPSSRGGVAASRRRIGLIVEGSPAREGAEIVDSEANPIGHVTSGCPAPTVKKNISMAYIKNGMHNPGTEVFVVVRGKQRKAIVSKMPFLPNKYFKEAAASVG